MKLLAVETSTQACSAALYVAGEIHEKYELAPREHTRLILPMIDNLMAEAMLKPWQLDGLAFSRGPGSFTGVRIATGIIQGIALGTDLPVVPVSTLSAMAQDFFNHQAVDVAFTAMDARMGEIFWGVYEKDTKGFARLIGEESVVPASEVAFPLLKGAGIGSGWAEYQQALTDRMGDLVMMKAAEILPRASAVAQLGVMGFDEGLAVPVERAMPVYLRDNVAKKESER